MDYQKLLLDCERNSLSNSLVSEKGHLNPFQVCKILICHSLDYLVKIEVVFQVKNNCDKLQRTQYLRVILFHLETAKKMICFTDSCANYFYNFFA